MVSITARRKKTFGSDLAENPRHVDFYGDDSLGKANPAVNEAIHFC
jgi:hypothetical protein